MVVRELIELLKKQDGDKVVILSSDPEGNDFYELIEVTSAKRGEDYNEYKSGTVCLWP